MKRVYETPSDGHYFFGYYDKSPLSNDNSMLLACKASFIDKMPSADEVLDIGYFVWKDSNEFIKLTETHAWNWQQGCMLQWLAPKYDEKIIYNDRVDGQFVTVIFDIKTKEKSFFPMAYYTMSSTGDFALCIDNERHYWFRGGYSYTGICNVDKKKPIDFEDGIWKLDLQSAKLIQIISLRTMLSHKPLSNMIDSVHYFEHLMICPNNNSFCFLHRWQTDDGGIYARLYTANIDGSDLYLLSDSGRMSHFSWRNEKEILAWGAASNPINSLRKYKNIVKYFVKPILPLYHTLVGDRSKIRSVLTGDCYLLFEDKTKNIKKIALNVLREDGHPSFNPQNQNLFVSDTYERNDSFRELFLFDIEFDKKILLDRLYSMPELDDSPIRCDLHPKWSLDGRYVVVDTTNYKRRSMFIYEQCVNM